MNDEERARIAANIEKYGWHALLVGGDDEGPPFAYTIGLQTTYRHPEILLFGLNADLKFMHGTLTIMADQIANGKRFAVGNQYADIVGDYLCTFVDIPAAAYDEYLGTAQGYHRGNWFNAVQCVWPDHDQRFPWDAGAAIQLLARQPVLGHRDGRPWNFGELHKHLWVITTKQVATGDRPVLRVFRDEDGWQFLDEGAEDCAVVCLGNLVDRDPSLEQIADLPKGWCAWREGAVGPWTREVFEANEGE